MTSICGANEISGSWFPSGFHGHYRSRTRSEFTVPYRHRAKPNPPQKFLDYTKERSNRHLFSRHDNRNAHSDMGDLETYFGMGMGKRKYIQPGQTQHTRSTRDLITWRGNESGMPLSTYRSHYVNARPPTSFVHNDSEPIHVRSNLELRRRLLRVSTAIPSQCRTVPLLAWNEPNETFHGKPGVGLRQPTGGQGNYSMSTPFAQTAPPAVMRSQTPGPQNFTVSETIVPLNTT